MICFEKIRYKNILSTGNTWTEIDVAQHPMTLVIGPNGAGKSTMLDVICLVLFNKPFREIKKDNLINSINGREAVGEVEFRSGSTYYKVCRGIKPDFFEIYKDGVLIQQDANIRDYQKYLENSILGFNMKSFTQIVIVGATSFTSFMKLKSYERRAFVENLLDIGIFSSMNKILKQRVKDTNEDIDAARKNIQTVMDKISMQKKYIEESKKSTGVLIDSKKRDLANNQLLVEQFTANVSSIQDCVVELQKSISDELIIRGTIKKLEEYRIKIDGNVKNTDRDIQFYQTNDICPKCHQNLANKDQHIAICLVEKKKFADGLAQLETEQSIKQERLNEIQSTQRDIQRKQTEITKFTTSINEIQKQITALLNEINTISSKKPVSEDMIEVSRQLYSDLETLNINRKALLEKKSYLDVANMLLQDNGIKSKIIKQYLPIINKMVNKYLAAMDFFVNFNIDEEFNETIKSRHRDIFTYDNFSEGEKLRIDIALLFTWRAVAKIKNSINTNLLMMDEILDGSLDANGMDEFMRLLNAFGTETNVLLISHRGDILADKFSHVLHFEKVGNFSEIKQ